MNTIFCTNFSLKKFKLIQTAIEKSLTAFADIIKKIMNLNEIILNFVFEVLKKYTCTCIRFTKDYNVYQYIKNKKYEDQEYS